MAVAQFLCGTSLLLFILSVKKDQCVAVVKIPGLIPLLALFGVLCLQLLPLPPALLKVLSPTTWQLYQNTIYQLEPQSWQPITVHLQATVFELFRFLTCVTIYFLTVQLFTSHRLLKRFLEILVWFMGGYAFLSLMQYLIPSDYIFWFVREWPFRRPHAFGTYVNGNHYAGLIEMVLPLTLALFLVSRPRVSYLNFRQKVVEFFKCPAASQHILLGVVVVLLAGTVFLSLSRGGIISASLSLLGFSLVLLVKGGNRRYGLIVLLLVAVIFIFIGSAGWDPIFDRFDRITTASGELADERWVYWHDSVSIIKDYPLFGSGAGSFIDIYPHYRSTVNNTYIVDHAHNDYVEFLVTLGAIGSLLLLAFLVSLFRQSYRSWRQRKNSFSNLIWLGSMFGLLSLLFHSVTDFNMFIGANAFIFFAICGIAVAAAHGFSSRHGQSDSGGRSYFSPLSPRFVRLGLPVLVVSLFLGATVNGLASYGDLRYESLAKQQLDNLDVDQVQLLSSEFDSLQRWLPFDSRLPFAQANLLVSQQQLADAIRCYQHALCLRPLNGEVAQYLGLLLGYQGDQLRANILLKAGLNNEPTQPNYYTTYITWLLSAGRGGEAQQWIGIALENHPNSFADMTVLFSLYDLTDQDLIAALPDSSRVQVKCGDYLLHGGNKVLAEQLFKRAFKLSITEEKPSATPVWRLRKIYVDRGDRQRAIALLNTALETFPTNAALRGNLASLYEQEGVSYRALEEYQQAYLLAPSQEWLKRGVERLQRH